MLFNFMLGEQRKKGYRVFVHIITVMILFFAPPVYINSIIQLFSRVGAFEVAGIVNAIVNLAMLAAFPFLVKLMIRLSILWP